MRHQSIYVAATGQHVGKTTSTLGLVQAFEDLQGIGEIGYCKPVGQEISDLFTQQVDKDAFLFSKTMEFELFPELHSPCILGRGATTAFLDNPEGFQYHDRILHAVETLNNIYDLVVYEGTGHPGVGSVVNLSNAKVAKMVGARVVLVVEGGIGSTIDSMCYALTPFEQQGVPIAGVIVNKVIPEKMEKVRKYLSIKLKQLGIPLLGIIPFDKNMGSPIMLTIQLAVHGSFLCNPHLASNVVDRIIPGSLVDELERADESDHLLIVVSQKRIGTIISQIKRVIGKQPRLQIAGVVVTGEGLAPVLLQPENMRFFKENKIPVVSTKLDTLGAFTKINRLEVKINTNTPWKIARAIELIKENVNLDLLF
ncbi:MAG: dethiobiotin synthetase [Polaribacter sp.]|jgi:dethiobiotin synthetase